MALRSSNIRLGLLALCIAMVLWGVAHSSSSIERGFDVPVVFHGLSEKLVITDQSADLVNVRVLGSRAALRNLSPTKMEYAVDVSGGKPGPAVYEVDVSHIELPRGARIVSRSPASIEVRFEPRGRKSVGVRVDVEGEPPEGFALGSVTVEPPRVWLVGARSNVLRLSEVVTETIELSDLRDSVEREVRLSLGGGLVWMEKNEPVKVKIQIEPAEETEGPEGGAERAGG